jgi:hypothetical protein
MATLCLISASAAVAQLPPVTFASDTGRDRARDSVRHFAIMAGLSQPVLFRGGNIELEYRTRNFVLGWSHGAGLQIDRFEPGLSAADKAEQAKIRMPWTTGPHAGYRITGQLTVAVDFKAHRVNANLPGGSVTRYTVYTVGPALNYDQPLGRKWFIQPTLRWWPTVGTTLSDGKASLLRANGSAYAHTAISLGIVPNIKIGRSF